jgi:hypothetical protein
MFGGYLVSVLAMTFSALSALTLIYAIRHLDASEEAASQPPAEQRASA